MTITIKKTYCTVRPIVAYRDMDFGPSFDKSPVGNNKGPTIKLPSGVKVCVGWGDGGKRACMTTFTRSLGPVFFWADESDLVPLDRAESEGLQPCFV